MNYTQVSNFLKCLQYIDDANYLNLHAARAANVSSPQQTPPVRGYEDKHDQERPNRNGDAHDLLIAKVTTMIVLFVASSLCGSIPFLLNRFFKFNENNTKTRSATVVKSLLHFGGGILLCTTFLHLLPEIQEAVELLQECGTIQHLSFPLAELLMCAGFFCMYLIEETIHSYFHRNSKRLLDKDENEVAVAAFKRGHSVRNSYLVKGGKRGSLTKNDLGEGGSGKCNLTEKTASSSLSTPSTTESTNTATLSVQDLIPNDLENQKYHLQKPNEPRTPSHAHHDHQHDDIQQYHATTYDHNHGHSHHHHHSHYHGTEFDANSDDGLITSSLRGFFIVLALSVHELFEGMAIGLEGSASDVWFMFGAVAAHKLVLAFCVGVELIVARTRVSLAVFYIFTFAVVSPLGIGIGILITNNGLSSGPTLTSAILQGLASGTLLYVVFFEILSKNHAGLWAYFALFAGFVIMFGLQRIGAQGHGHSHGGCDSSNDEHNHHHASLSILPRNTGNGKGTPSWANENFEEQMNVLRSASEKLLKSATTKNSKLD